MCVGIGFRPSQEMTSQICEKSRKLVSKSEADGPTQAKAIKNIKKGLYRLGEGLREFSKILFMNHDFLSVKCHKFDCQGGGYGN